MVAFRNRKLELPEKLEEAEEERRDGVWVLKREEAEGRKRMMQCQRGRRAGRERMQCERGRRTTDQS